MTAVDKPQEGPSKPQEAPRSGTNVEAPGKPQEALSKAARGILRPTLPTEDIAIINDQGDELAPSGGQPLTEVVSFEDGVRRQLDASNAIADNPPVVTPLEPSQPPDNAELSARKPTK